MSATNNQYYCVIISRGLRMHPCLLVPNRSPGCEGGRLGIGFTGFEPNRRATPIFDANLGRSSMNATDVNKVCNTKKIAYTSRLPSGIELASQQTDALAGSAKMYVSLSNERLPRFSERRRALQ